MRQDEVPAWQPSEDEASCSNRIFTDGIHDA